MVVTRATWEKVAPKIRPKDDVKPEAIYEDLNIFEIDPTQDFEINCETQLVTVKDGVDLPAITAFRLLAAKLKRLGRNNPILLKDCLNFEPEPLEPKIALLRASVVIGSLLADGIGDAILVRGESGAGQSLRLAYNILQAAGCRSFKTDYVACPSCGRTLFNLQTVTARIKARTEHLKGVKIAIMGCIVNGPGEMADADFGYVGGAPEQDQSLRRQAGRSNSTSPKPKPWSASWTSSRNTASGWSRKKMRGSTFCRASESRIHWLCSQKNTERSKTNGTQRTPAVEDRSLTTEAYLQLGMPSPDRMWTPEDYSQAVRILKTITEKDARELPRYDSQNSGKLFARISSRDNLAAMLNKNLPLNTRLPLVDGYLEGVKQILIHNVHSESPA